MNALAHASLFSLFSIVITATPMVAGFAFAVRPSAVRLALVRALTLVGIFVSVASLISGIVNVLLFMGGRAAVMPEPQAEIYNSAAAILIIPFISCVFLALAWAGVAIGLRKPFEH